MESLMPVAEDFGSGDDGWGFFFHLFFFECKFILFSGEGEGDWNIGDAGNDFIDEEATTETETEIIESERKRFATKGTHSSNHPSHPFLQSPRGQHSERGSRYGAKKRLFRIQENAAQQKDEFTAGLLISHNILEAIDTFEMSKIFRSFSEKNGSRYFR